MDPNNPTTVSPGENLLYSPVTSKSHFCSWKMKTLIWGHNPDVFCSQRKHSSETGAAVPCICFDGKWEERKWKPLGSASFLPLRSCSQGNVQSPLDDLASSEFSPLDNAGFQREAVRVPLGDNAVVLPTSRRKKSVPPAVCPVFQWMLENCDDLRFLEWPLPAAGVGGASKCDRTQPPANSC